MSRADELRAQLAVADLEDELVRLKADGTDEQLRSCKEELRYARWVHRGGPAEERQRLADYEAAVAADPALDTDPIRGHTNRAVAALYQRWLTERAEG